MGSSFARRLFWTINGLFCVAVGLSAYRYLIGVGPLSEDIMKNTQAMPWLWIHVATAATAIVVAPPQLLHGVRERWPGVHRWLGRVYVLGCLLGGISGLALALGSAAGPIATAGFGLLAVTWIFATAQGLRTLAARRFSAHRAWMLRSFALTNAAVTLRLYVALLPLFGLPFLESYRAISFLCWIPNLIAVELYLRIRSRGKGSAPRIETIAIPKPALQGP